MEIGPYHSYLEVDFGKMKENWHKVRAAAGKREIIPVMKADGYGIGLAALADFAVHQMGAKVLAVAQTCEGLALRDAGFSSPDIMLLGPAPEHAVPYAVENRLMLPVFCRENALAVERAAAAQGVKAMVQIKIDTGMNRVGVRPGAPLEEFLALLKVLPHVEAAGVFTHFVNATYTGDPQTPAAYAAFVRAVEQVRSAGFAPRYIHCCNTGATSWFREDAISTHVRPGSLYMGYDSMDDGTNWLGVEEGISWRAFVTNVHRLPAGESCGYCNHYTAQTDRIIATVDVGYADGLFRPMGQGSGYLLIREKPAPYLATSMDQTMVDVTDIPGAAIGDTATIFGHTLGGTLLPLARLQTFTGQNLSYPMCLLTKRVKRIYRY